jgi:hypothetical protein
VAEISKLGHFFGMALAGFSCSFIPNHWSQTGGTSVLIDQFQQFVLQPIDLKGLCYWAGRLFYQTDWSSLLRKLSLRAD